MRLNECIERIPPSATLELSAKVTELRKKGEDVIGFGAGEPDFDTPKNVKDEAVKAIEENFSHYTPVPGIPELREAIAEKLGKENGIECKAENIIVNSGAKQSLFNALMVLLNQRDEVLLPAPYWVSYREQINICSGKPVLLETSEESCFKVTAEQVESAVTEETKALILNFPSNPTGMTYRRKELKEISEVVKEKKIFLISDETYEKILYEGKHVSPASFDEETKELTLTVNGVSKSYAMTGWRIGYCCGEKKIIEKMSCLQGHSTSGACSISQKAALEAITGEQGSVEEMRKEFQKRRDLIVKLFEEIPGITCLKPEGAFYVFPNVSHYLQGKIHSPLELCDFLLEKGKVAVVPGEAFGSEKHVRLSYACSKENIKEGLKRIKETLEKVK